MVPVIAPLPIEYAISLIALPKVLFPDTVNSGKIIFTVALTNMGNISSIEELFPLIVFDNMFLLVWLIKLYPNVFMFAQIPDSIPLKAPFIAPIPADSPKLLQLQVLFIAAPIVYPNAEVSAPIIEPPKSEVNISPLSSVYFNGLLRQ